MTRDQSDSQIPAEVLAALEAMECLSDAARGSSAASPKVNQVDALSRSIELCL